LEKDLDRTPGRKGSAVVQRVSPEFLKWCFWEVSLGNQVEKCYLFASSRMWITVARGESLIKVRNPFAPVMGRPCNHVTSCMLSLKASPRIASDFAARSPISVVVSGICSFLRVGVRSHRVFISSCACVLVFMAPCPTQILCSCV